MSSKERQCKIARAPRRSVISSECYKKIEFRSFPQMASHGWLQVYAKLNDAQNVQLSLWHMQRNKCLFESTVRR